MRGLRGTHSSQTTFERKKDADAYHASVKIDVSRGTHTPESRSITVVEAAQLWLTTCENHGLERTTLTMYRQHVEALTIEHHLDP
jgi:hypothetical protein